MRSSERDHQKLSNFEERTITFFHRYCTKWRNKRCAIIRIAWVIIQTYQTQGKYILEVGNAISHIYPVVHDVLDKYEIADGVTNTDIVDFPPLKRHDLNISIVTMQHVGYNEYPREPTKILKAMENQDFVSGWNNNTTWIGRK